MAASCPPLASSLTLAPSLIAGAKRGNSALAKWGGYPLSDSLHRDRTLYRLADTTRYVYGRRPPQAPALSVVAQASVRVGGSVRQGFVTHRNECGHGTLRGDSTSMLPDEWKWRPSIELENVLHGVNRGRHLRREFALGAFDMEGRHRSNLTSLRSRPHADEFAIKVYSRTLAQVSTQVPDARSAKRSVLRARGGCGIASLP
jgi:hypothetical protein